MTMSFVKIILIIIYLKSGTQDTVFRVCTNNDTIYIMSDDIVSIDTLSLFSLNYHLSTEIARGLDSININLCQVYFNLKNKGWVFLQKYDMRSASIPEGYYVWTDFGMIMNEERVIHVGYNYPEKIKKKRNFRKRYLTCSPF